MSVVTYTTFGNEIVYENRAGLQHDYMRDSLGSTYALLDDTQTMTDEFTYWPYGEIRTQTGSTGTPFTFCGTMGYCFDLASTLYYIKLRHVAATIARWLTVAPLWPDEAAYAYASDQPVMYIDPTGQCNWFVTAWNAAKDWISEPANWAAGIAGGCIGFGLGTLIHSVHGHHEVKNQHAPPTWGWVTINMPILDWIMGCTNNSKTCADCLQCCGTKMKDRGQLEDNCNINCREHYGGAGCP